MAVKELKSNTSVTVTVGIWSSLISGTSKSRRRMKTPISYYGSTGRCQFSMSFDFTDNNLVVLINDGDKFC